MAKKKIVEPEDLVKINCLIREYGGMYANWKSGGCKGAPPTDLIEKMIEMNAEIDTYLKEIK